MDIENEKETELNKNKYINVYFCVITSRYFSTNIHRLIKQIKQSFYISRMRVPMSYHIFNNLSELLNVNLAANIGLRILSIDLMYK